MDDERSHAAPSPDERRPTADFAPDRRLSAAFGVGAVIALLLLVTADTAGRLLFAGAAVLLAAYAVTDLVFRPRLSVDARGLRVHSPMARADIAWDDVESVRADTRQRLGLRSTTLEIDAGEQLIVLSRRALGADPETVAQTVTAFDPR